METARCAKRSRRQTKTLTTGIVGRGGYGADTIRFRVSGTITLGATLPEVTDSDRLIINGKRRITIIGNNRVRVMIVRGLAQLALQELTITEGLSLPISGIGNGGGGISNRGGILFVTKSIFSYNHSNTGGGAIVNTFDPKLVVNGQRVRGSLTVRKCIFSHNSANESPRRVFTRGGAIENNDELSVSDSTFNDNSADYGGAIFRQGQDSNVLDHFMKKYLCAQHGILRRRGN